MPLGFDLSDLTKAFTELEKDATVFKEAITEDCQEQLKQEIKRTAPKDTGKYAKSWRASQVRWGTGADKPKLILAPAKKYYNLMIWLEFTGTKPHIIKPKKAKMLSWIDKKTGKRRFAMKVRHPGTKPQPHLRPAIRKVLPRSVSAGIDVLKQKHIWLE